jgi:dihydrofolate reductase
MKRTLSLIVAFAENQVIGRAGELPWRLSADLQRFKRLTMGHHIIMGRKTYDSIGRLLPGRTSLILTRNTEFEVQGALVANSIEQAMEIVRDDSEPFVIGGEEIFRLALPHTRRLYLSRVHANVQGDCWFPQLDWNQWQLQESIYATADAKNEFDHTFEIYEYDESKVTHT